MDMQSTTVTKYDIAKELSKRLGFSVNLCRQLVDHYFLSIRSILKSEEKFTCYKYGRFTVKKKKARPGNNLHTGEKVVIPAKTVVSFVPSQALKDKINQ